MSDAEKERDCILGIEGAKSQRGIGLRHISSAGAHVKPDSVNSKIAIPWFLPCNTMPRMATHKLSLLAVILAAATVPAFSQEIQMLDPALSQIVSADAKLERVANGFNKWTEGPVWTREGTLLFAEIPANNI